MKTVTALKDGFYELRRIKKGTTFRVSDKTTGKWFIEASEYKEPEVKPLKQEVANASKREAESFTTRMRQLADGEIESDPDTMSKANAKLPKLPAVKKP